MENQLLKKSGIIAAIVTFALLGAWFSFSKLSLGIDTSNWTPYAMKKDSVVSEQLIIMCGTSGSGIVFGTTSGVWVGTPTDSTLARVFFNTATGRLEFKPSGTTTSFPFGSVTVAYLDANYATIGSVSAKLDAVGGVGTNNTFNNPTLAGVGTQTATIRANGLDITPAEYASVNNATSELQGQITTATGSITNHVHSGSDGTTQVSHTNLTNKGTQTHPQIDDFIASKAQASGIASLDSNSLVIQNPASASKTPGTSTIVMTGTNTDRLADAFLSDNITKLGTPTTDNISEGSTNKYYTDSRVTAAVGSTTLSTFSDTKNAGSATNGQFLKKVGEVWQGADNSVSVNWSDLNNIPTGNSYVGTQPGLNKIPFTGSQTTLPISWIDTTIIPINATRTAATGTNTSGIFKMLETTKPYTNTSTVLMRANNIGSSTFTDSSSNAYAIVTGGNTIGTATSKFSGRVGSSC